MKTAVAKSQQSRARIVAAAAKAFRRSGFGGIGVDGLAKGAKLTSGAFYFHFPSKLSAFVEAVGAGMEELRVGIAAMQTEHGTHWLREFVRFYLDKKRTCEMGQGCTLPTLTPEVERAGDRARQVYQQGLEAAAGAVQTGLQASSDLTSEEQSWALLAMLSGGVNMARAVEDQELSQAIASAVSKAALLLSEPGREARSGRRPRAK